MDIIDRLKKGTQHHQAGRLRAAAKVYKQILRVFPQHPDALHLSGLVAHQQGNVDQAVRLIDQAIQEKPNHPVYLKNICAVLASAYLPDQAAAYQRRLVDLEPQNSDVWFGLGNCCQQLGEYDAAIDAYSKALQIQPEHIGAAHNMAAAFHAQGEDQQALNCLQAILEKAPASAEIHFSLGSVYLAVGMVAEAIHAFQEAIAIKPDYADARYNLANLHKDVGNFSAAIENYTALLNIVPEMAEAHNNLGNVFLLLNRDDRALQCYHAAVAIDPKYPEALHNISIVLQNKGQYDQAMTFCRQAMEVKPGYEPACASLVHQMRQACAWDELEKHDRKLDRLTHEALSRGRRPAENPFLNITRHADPAANLAVASAWSRELSTRIQAIATVEKSVARPTPAGRSRAGRLKIGYLSNNFRNHPTAHLLARLFKLHCRDQFEVYAYSYGNDDGSEYRKRIRKDCDHFIDLNEIGDREAANVIRENRIDILIDLVGHMQGNRMGICARRPAPIQVRYLGMAGTSGADFYDYLIADEVVVPEAHAQFYSEQLVYLPHCYQINDDHQQIADAVYSRTDFDLPIDGMVYCSFASHYKLDATMFAVWMRILDKTEDSVLWLTPGSPAAEHNLRNQARTHGIDPDRLVFTHRVAKEHHLARLALADLALDTRLVGGAATTSDALWAGVPTVTLQGNHFASRMSASLLNAIGLKDLITTTLDAYESMAVRLGNDSHMLDSIRNRLSHKLSSTYLFDTAYGASCLEKGFEAMWARFENGQGAGMIRL